MLFTQKIPHLVLPTQGKSTGHFCMGVPQALWTAPPPPKKNITPAQSNSAKILPLIISAKFLPLIIIYNIIHFYLFVNVFQRFYSNYT